MPKMQIDTTLWVSVLTGIGFTMSIFIGNLAFTGQDQILNDARINILFASLLAALLGYITLYLSSDKDKS